MLFQRIFNFTLILTPQAVNCRIVLGISLHKDERRENTVCTYLFVSLFTFVIEREKEREAREREIREKEREKGR